VVKPTSRANSSWVNSLCKRRRRILAPSCERLFCVLICFKSAARSWHTQPFEPNI